MAKHVYTARLTISLPVLVTLESDEELSSEEIMKQVGKAKLGDLGVAYDLDKESNEEIACVDVMCLEEDISMAIRDSWSNDPDGVRIEIEEDCG